MDFWDKHRVQELENRADRSVLIRGVSMPAYLAGVYQSVYHGLGRPPKDVQIFASRGTGVSHRTWNYHKPNETHLFIASTGDQVVDILVTA